MRAALPPLALALVVLVAYSPANVSSTNSLSPPDTTWTWPDHSENLQVLPSDTGPFELRQVMREFTRALGVRCEYCHVGEDGMDLSEFDFASDDNDHKEIAREMIHMTWKINNELLANIEGLHEAEGTRVTCYTCHREEARPETIAPEREWTPPGVDEGGEEADQDHGGHDHDQHEHGHDGGD